jgi:hypothetical protein
MAQKCRFLAPLAVLGSDSIDVGAADLQSDTFQE